jgi:hypothetical protein
MVSPMVALQVFIPFPVFVSRRVERDYQYGTYARLSHPDAQIISTFDTVSRERPSLTRSIIDAPLTLHCTRSLSLAVSSLLTLSESLLTEQFHLLQ